MLCQSTKILVVILFALAGESISVSLRNKPSQSSLNFGMLKKPIQSFMTRIHTAIQPEQIFIRSAFQFAFDNDMFGSEPVEERFYNSKVGVYAYLPRFRPDKLISFAQYLLLCVCSIYITLFSAKHGRTTMIIFCFLNSYFLLTFTVVQLDVYKTNVLEYQFVLFFFGLMMGCALTILTNLYMAATCLMAGFAFVTSISLICAQFVIDFNSNFEWGMFLLAYVVSGLLASVGFKFCNKDLSIVIGALYGATVLMLYTGILTEHIVSFEDEVVYLPRKLAHLEKYIGLITIATVSGLLLQYFIFIASGSGLKDDSMADFSESSFWD
jgi:hypothetical protein